MITPVFGKTYPVAAPGTLGATVAQLVTAGLLEVTVTLSNSVDGEVNLWVLGYDADCGWQPLAQLTCNKRESPALAGRNGFRDIEIPSDRYVCLYAPELVAANVVVACIEAYVPVTSSSSGGGSGIAGFWVPGVPPASPSADDDEFSGSTLDPRWNLHTAEFSIAPITWTLNTLDEATADTGTGIYRYQMAASANPSALCVQPSGPLTNAGGLSRILTTETEPTDWILRWGIAPGGNNENPVDPDIVLILFMANDDPGNGYGDWDSMNWVGIYITATAAGITVQGAKTVAGVFSLFADGVGLTSYQYAEPAEYQIKKTGDFYRVSVRWQNGTKGILMSEDLTGLGLHPVRFGATIQAAAVPNPIINFGYVRHEFAPRGF